MILYQSVVTGKYMLLGRNSLGTKFRNKPSPIVNRAQFFEDCSPQNIDHLPSAKVVSKMDVGCNGLNGCHDLKSAPDHDLDLNLDHNLDLVSQPEKCVVHQIDVGCNDLNGCHDLDSTPDHDLDLNLDLNLDHNLDLVSQPEKCVVSSNGCW